MELRVKYNLQPWQNVRWGIMYQIPLNTMHPECKEVTLACGAVVPGSEECHVIGMKYDDAWYMLRNWLWVLR